jgi:hypothetical protein
LAATTLNWARERYRGSSRLKSIERETYLKLTEKYQGFNPFKFIIYSGKAGLDVPQTPVASGVGNAKANEQQDALVKD